MSNRAEFAVGDQPIRRQVVQIAWPVIVENLLQQVLSVIGFWMVSRLGVAAIAGTGTAQQYLFIGFSAFGAIGVGASVLVSHSVGAGDAARAGRVVKQSLLLALAIGFAVAVVGNALAREANLALGVSREVAEFGATYLRVSAVGSPLLVLVFIASALLRGAGDSRTPMVINLVTSAFGAVVTYPLIFGIGGWPGLGVAGAALGPIFAWVIASGFMLRALFAGRPDFALLNRNGWRPDRRVMRDILNIGIPSGVEQILSSGGFLLVTGVVAQLGTDSLAAFRVVMQTLGFSFMPGVGFGVAATTLTGIHLGAGRPDMASAATWTATRWAVAWMALIGAVLFVFGEPVMLLFAPGQPEVVHIGAEAMRIAVFAQPFFGLINGLSGGLRGAGDTRFPMLFAILGIWLVRLPGSWLLGLGLGMGLAGIYVASISDSVVRAAVFVWRYRRGAWREMNVLGSQT